MFRSSFESVTDQLWKCSGAVTKVLVGAPEQLGYADFLHTMTPIRFHTQWQTDWPNLKMLKNGYATLQRYVKWCKRLYSHIYLRTKMKSQPLSHRRIAETGTTKCEKGSDFETAATPIFALRRSENGWINSFANVSQPGRFATLFPFNRDAFLSNWSFQWHFKTVGRPKCET